MTLLVTWKKKDSLGLAIVTIAWEAVGESSRDIAILGPWRMGKRRGG